MDKKPIKKKHQINGFQSNKKVTPKQNTGDHHKGHHGHHYDIASADFDSKMVLKKKNDQMKLEEITNTRHHIALLAKRTNFTLEQVEALLRIYKRLTSLGKMDRLRFRETMYSTFEITDDIILDRTFSAFDGDSQGSVSETEWVLGMSAFLRGSLDEQIAYCYEVYDINNDRGIGREEVYQLLQNCISPLPGEGLAGIEADEVDECSREVAEMAMKKLDIDHNGLITYSDFYEAVNRDPLLIEALGPCLANSNRVKVFLSLFTEDYWNFSTNLSHPRDSAWDRERNKFTRKREIMHKITHGLTAAPALLTHKERKKIGIQNKN